MSFASKGMAATAQDEAYRAILQDIRSGRYQPGERLIPETIARELAMSRMPVREAFQRLLADVERGDAGDVQGGARGHRRAVRVLDRRGQLVRAVELHLTHDQAAFFWTAAPTRGSAATTFSLALPRRLE